jgi:hypothetical protein
MTKPYRDPCKIVGFVLLNAVKDLYIAEYMFIKILHCVQNDNLLKSCKGITSQISKLEIRA